MVTCLALYVVRMFAITAGFHRLLAHRTYRTSRVFQFLIAFTGTASYQKGPLWWSAHHRRHHLVADTEPGFSFAADAQVLARTLRLVSFRG